MSRGSAASKARPFFSLRRIFSGRTFATGAGAGRAAGRAGALPGFVPVTGFFALADGFTAFVIRLVPTEAGFFFADVFDPGGLTRATCFFLAGGEA